LAEFGNVCRYDNFVSVLAPRLLVKASNLPAKRFGVSWRSSSLNQASDSIIAKKAGFLRHHVLLRTTVGCAVNSERRGPPLRKAPWTNATVRIWVMATEEEIFQISPVPLECQ